MARGLSSGGRKKAVVRAAAQRERPPAPLARKRIFPGRLWGLPQGPNLEGHVRGRKQFDHHDGDEDRNPIHGANSEMRGQGAVGHYTQAGVARKSLRLLARLASRGATRKPRPAVSLPTMGPAAAVLRAWLILTPGEAPCQRSRKTPTRRRSSCGPRPSETAGHQHSGLQGGLAGPIAGCRPILSANLFAGREYLEQNHQDAAARV